MFDVLTSMQQRGMHESGVTDALSYFGVSSACEFLTLQKALAEVMPVWAVSYTHLTLPTNREV